MPAAPAQEVDPTGAGDVFGVVLTLELAAGEPLARRAAGPRRRPRPRASSRARASEPCRTRGRVRDSSTQSVSAFQSTSVP